MRRVLFCVATLVIATNLSQAQQASITWVPNTSISTEGSCVSGNGSVVAVRNYNGNAYKWENSTTTSLGFGIPRAVSADGSTVVFTNSTVVQWRNGQSETLGILGAGAYTSYSDAFACSANGDVIVGKSSSSYYPFGGEAFIWKNGDMTGCGGLISSTDPLNPYSQATDISNDGKIVVGHSGSWNYGAEAFRWENGIMVGLGTLLGLNPNYHSNLRSEATAISGNGQIIVGWSSSSIGNQPFRWENGVMTGLGHLHPNSQAPTIATGISYDGSIIVGWEQSNGDAAFLWDVQHGMRNLEDVVKNEYNLDLGSYKLLRSLGISDDGKTIVGYGYGPDSSGNNYEEAFIITIPEPATILLIGLGGVILRRRKH